MKYKPNIEDLIAVMRILSQYICNEIDCELKNDELENRNELNVCIGNESDRLALENFEDEYDTD